VKYSIIWVFLYLLENTNRFSRTSKKSSGEYLAAEIKALIFVYLIILWMLWFGNHQRTQQSSKEFTYWKSLSICFIEH